MMTFAEVVKTSVNFIPNSRLQVYTHPEDHSSLNYDTATTATTVDGWEG